METGTLKRLNPESTFCEDVSILKYDPICNTLVASFSNLKGPPKIGLLSFPASLEQFQSANLWTHLQLTQGGIFEQIDKTLYGSIEQRTFTYNAAEGFFWRLPRFDPNVLASLPSDLQNLYTLNQKLNPFNYQNDTDRPLVVLLHGGPHGFSSGVFTLLRFYFLLQGYNILSVNFTGSAGYGQKHIDNLLGKIGEIDADEIIQLINQVIGEKLCAPSKVFCYGGSYGGYISGILSTRYAKHFRGAILLNPVVNMNFMLATTDIPEWNCAEVFGSLMNWNLTPEQQAELYRMSPMSQKCQVPTLLLLGAKDRRVPYQGGVAYHHQTRANKCPIETYIYPESDHSLADSLQTEIDWILKVIRFIEERLTE